MNALVPKKEVAVIGDEPFVTGFRLAGVKKWYIIDITANEETLRNKLRDIFSRIYEDYKVGVVIVHDSLKNIVEKIRKTVTYPVIIYIPSLSTAGKINIKEYYSSILRAYLGISVEV
jgi:V/A-type H+-transporting ATPase subunit F